VLLYQSGLSHISTHPIAPRRNPTLAPIASLSVLALTSSNASNIPSIPVALNSVTGSSSPVFLSPSGSSRENAAIPAPVGPSGLSAAFFLDVPALGALVGLDGRAASSAANRAAFSAFFAAGVGQDVYNL
jgi:hypothetical protein